MEDDNEYTNLPTEDMCVHKLWKARVAGYENAAKLFKQIDDDKSPEWNKYLGLIKKFVSDSNAMAQEKGLEAALAFVENCGFAGKTVGEVMSGIVAKCVAAPKTKTKELALQVILMYIEIEKHEATQEELMKGMEHKNPKIVSACISTITTALRQFGNKVISIKLLVKKIPAMLTDRDKDVRTEGKALVVEMHRWIGPALEPHIGQLQAVVLQELRDAFSEGGQKVIPERYLRSQQPKASALTQGDTNEAGDYNNEDAEENDEAPDVDPYELMDPVDILSKIPKDFYEKLEAKKWQERKEALDALEALLKAAPKLEQGDYGDLARAMKKVISKDTNVQIVALAGRCVSMLAIGLKKRFQTYTGVLLPCCLDKFKEKKTNVVTALREAVDAMYLCTTIETIAEDVVEALGNKNPAVKAETTAFLARAIARTQPTALTKKLLKIYVPALLAVLESADPVVRDQAAEALGTATKLVGEKNISPFIGKLDNLKEQKIKECCEKAVILVKIAGPKKEVRPKTAPESKNEAVKAGSTQPRPVKRPTTAVAKKVLKKPGSVDVPKGMDRSDELQEREVSQDDVDLKAEELMGASFLNDITDANWKVRLEAVQNFSDVVSGLTPSSISSQILFKILNKKPGLKDNNFQSLKLRLETVKIIAGSFPVSTVSVDHILCDIVEKLSDPKCSQVAGEALTALSEATNLDYVSCQALEYAMDKQKSPRVQSEIFDWASSALLEFGMVFNIKNVLNYVKKAMAATNPQIRVSVTNFLTALYRYMGPSLFNQLDAAKIVLKPQMKQEIEKNGDEKPPAPTRGVKKSASKGSMGDEIEYNGDEQFDDENSTPVQDVRPRVDINPLITEALITEINDKNWKVRNEALEKVKNFITNAQSIKPTIGELPQSLAHRLVDSNSKIGQLTFQICEALVIAMGPKGKVHIRTFFPGFFQGLGDSKTWIRSAALQCINEWVNQCGTPPVFEGEMVFDALKTGGPILRAELWTWLAEKLPLAPPKTIPREELSICIPLLYAALEDRGAEVRRGAGEAVLGFMMHLGPESMVRQAEKLKPGSKSVVQAALDKARPNMPVQPLPKSAESKTIKSGPPGKAQAASQQKVSSAKPTKGLVKSASASSTRSKNKDEDLESLVPLLPINNIKHQRIIDDQKLKVLKWNFVTPREEFFDLLKDQMATAGLNKNLVSNMFHNDFRYHIKAIESLVDDLPDNGPALIANLDLIFKWLTLRFFDTNPSVLLKGLEYLGAVFTYLISENYQLAEYEAQCFIPYLVLKVGDPKDTVRNGVKSLLKQICIVYSSGKLFGHLMEGLKSKNARQRTECLEVLSLLIESFGVTICNPSPAAALKEIAKQISDRDNSVRNAALNCVVQAYNIEGERVYKMIGQISDKDHSLLEERIKRAAKTKDTTNRKTMLFTAPPAVRPNQLEPKDMKQNTNNVDQNPPDFEDEEDEAANDYLPPPTREPIKKIIGVARRRSYGAITDKKLPFTNLPLQNIVSPYKHEISKSCNDIKNESVRDIPFIAPLMETASSSQLSIAPASLPPIQLPASDELIMSQPDFPPPRPISGMFGLDPNVLAAMESEKLTVKKPAIQEVDLAFLDEPTVTPSTLLGSHPLTTARPISNVMPLSPPSRLNLHSSILTVNPHQHMISEPQPLRFEQDNILSRTIQSISSSNLNIAINALSQVEGILRSNRANLMSSYEEQLLLAMVEQFKRLQRPGATFEPNELCSAYGYLISVLNSFYEEKASGRNVSSSTVAAVIDQLLRLLVSRVLEKEGDDNLVRAVNGVCVKMLDRSDHTALICALVTLLQNSVAGDPSSQRYQELEMKCLWKVMKMMPSWEVDTIVYEQVLYKLHLFFKAYPSAYWKKNSNLNDTPYRTIKTVIHTIIKKKGKSIMDHVSSIPDFNDSELHHYLFKLFKAMKFDDLKKENTPTADSATTITTTTKLPRLVHEELLQIVKRIGDRNHCKEGLGQLYDLRERYPTIDIWAHLKDTSTLFRTFIERGLREVAEERRAIHGDNPPPFIPSLPLTTMPVVPNISSSDGDIDSNRSHLHHLERLRALQAKAGMMSDSASNSQPRTPIIDNRTLADSIEDNAKHNIDPKFDLPNLHSQSSRKEPHMEALRQKLQQLKSANR